MGTRPMASTSVTGGGIFVVATASSCFLAAVLLWVSGLPATIVVIVHAGTAFDFNHSQQSAQHLDPCKDERDEGGGFARV